MRSKFMESLLQFLRDSPKPSKADVDFAHQALKVFHCLGIMQGDFQATSQEAFEALMVLYPKDCIAEEFIELSYDEFLQSQYWQVVRKYILYKNGCKCQLCSETKELHVHHKTYKHRGHEHKHLEDLIVLCSKCHARHHDKLQES